MRHKWAPACATYFFFAWPYLVVPAMPMTNVLEVVGKSVATTTGRTSFPATCRVQRCHVVSIQSTSSVQGVGKC